MRSPGRLQTILNEVRLFSFRFGKASDQLLRFTSPSQSKANVDQNVAWNGDFKCFLAEIGRASGSEEHLDSFGTGRFRSGAVREQQECPSIGERRCDWP